jgi:hypothetical protein
MTKTEIEIDRLQTDRDVLLKACKAFADQIEWKPPWDNEGWIRCHNQARAAIALCEKGGTA